MFVRGKARRRHLIAESHRRGTRPDTVTVENTGRKGAFVFADVFLARNGPLDAAYTLRIRTKRVGARRGAAARALDRGRGVLHRDAEPHLGLADADPHP